MLVLRYFIQIYYGLIFSHTRLIFCPQKVITGKAMSSEAAEELSKILQ